MNSPIPSWRPACPVLYLFCESLRDARVYPHLAKPEVIAARFRAFIEASHPFDMRQANAMIQVLGLSKIVFFQPRLKDLTGENRARGMWLFDGGKFIIYVQPVKKRPNGLLTRPTSSIIHTLLHEVGEVILEIGYEFAGQHNRMTTRRREWWANRFAGMCVMPPERFTRDAASYELDLRDLSVEYETSLASASRQIRDAALPDEFYYFARFDFVDDPKEACDDLEEGEKAELFSLLDRTDGYVVRIRDVVRKKIDHHRARRGELPMHNLPGSRVYRVANPVLRECVESGRPLLLEDIPGGAAFERVYHDLFGLQNMTLLIIPYGYGRTRGFFLQAVEPTTAHCLRVQAQELGIEAKHGVTWLFSSVDFKAPLKKSIPAQKTLKFENPREAHLFAYQWLKHEQVNWRTGRIKPPISDTGTT
jgi:hypothetical protein